MSSTERSGIFTTTLQRAIQWARAKSLWYYPVQTGCCADEVLDVVGARYDLERFGCTQQVEASHADLLIISGVISHKAAIEVRRIYDQMSEPKYVLAIGSCATCGGAFSPEITYANRAGVDAVVPVDVFVPGCPPRPEAVMNGLITLQEKIRGTK